MDRRKGKDFRRLELWVKKLRKRGLENEDMPTLLILAIEELFITQDLGYPFEPTSILRPEAQRFLEIS